jgi:L-ascorbate metabolism protein UlaG (beta-lactamase superfamily)
MQGTILLLPLLFLPPLLASTPTGQEETAEDTVQTSAGDLTISFIGHGTLMFRHGGKVIHVDPVGREGDYSVLADADLILVTHEHGDHLDVDAIAEILTQNTSIVVSKSCEGRLEEAVVLENGEETTAAGFRVEAVPAYNVVHMRSEGQPYHPKGSGNGYIITFGDTRVYVAGDTEDTPEMMALDGIDIAFLPMNLPYTMTPEMVAEAARAFRPRVLYPYHFGETNTDELVSLLAGEEGIEVRVRARMR